MKNGTTQQRIIAVMLLCVISFTAFAAGNVIKLDSGKPMREQIDSFKEWYNSLSLLDRASWDLAFNELTDPWNTESAYNISSFGNLSNDLSGSDEAIVYVLPSGEVYHMKSSCQYVKSKDNVRTMTLSDAISAGYSRPCSKCGK